MATQKKVGDLIKEARTKAGLTQEQLASQIDGLSASDVSKAERGEKELPQATLKLIAKATGVTQKSLLEAPSGATKTAAKTSTAKTSTAKTSTAKTSTAKTSTAKTSTAKTSSSKTSTAKKTSSGTSVKLTAAEKKFVELYRAADAETRKAAEAVLKGEKVEDGSLLETLLGGALNLLGK